MDRALIHGNRIVDERQRYNAKKILKERLRQAPKVIDNEAPYGYLHPLNKQSKIHQVDGKLQFKNL